MSSSNIGGFTKKNTANAMVSIGEIAYHDLSHR
jgi:hypothetical protein